MLVNAGICAGIFFSGLTGLFIPLNDSSDPKNIEKLNSDQNWRIVWAIPIFMEIFSLVTIPVFFKSLSLKDAIQNS